MSRNSVSWSRAHQGKRRHRTWAGAWLHVLKILVRYRDRLHVYQCRWGDDRKPMARAHYHAGHAPGSVVPRPGDARLPGMQVNRPGRQMIIGFSELQLSTLKTRAANRSMPYQQYAATIIHDALAEPVPRELRPKSAEVLIERCPVHAGPVGDGRHCIACDGGVF